MPKISMSDMTVKTLPEGLYFDERVPAFGLRVGKRRRTWLVLRGARSDKHRLGHYPTVSLAQARRKAFAILGTTYVPLDAPSFTEARDLYLEIKAKTLKEGSLYQTTRLLKGHFHWTKTVEKITHIDVTLAIDAIDAPSEAAHAFKDIRAFFNWCVPKYIPHSPCTGLKPPSKYVPRDRLLTDAEIKRLWDASFAVGAYGLQVRRLIVSGQRCNQMFSFMPQWIDEAEKLLIFPKHIMKGNAAHTIPYGDLMASLLTDFPNVTNQGKFKTQLDKLSGISEYTLHDIRRYFSSTHAKLRTPLDCTEMLISHISGSRSPVQRIYDLYDRMQEMREAVTKYEAHIQALCCTA